jgi:hypothetical protein
MNHGGNQNSLTRRAFLKNTAWGSALAGVLGLAAVLIARNAGAGDKPCRIASPCADCDKLAGCADPRAIASRAQTRATL